MKIKKIQRAGTWKEIWCWENVRFSAWHYKILSTKKSTKIESKSMVHCIMEGGISRFIGVQRLLYLLSLSLHLVKTHELH
jgi:hypothetical protein